MNLLPFFQWCDRSTVGTMVRDSPWAFAVIESVHLVALGVIGGAVLLVDMRLLGFGLRNQPIRTLARQAWPWLVGSLGVMLVTGVLLFLSEAIKCYESTAFATKMTSLVMAMLFTFTLRRKVTGEADSRFPPIVYRLVALVSLALWFAVGASGRWIGFEG